MRGGSAPEPFGSRNRIAKGEIMANEKILVLDDEEIVRKALYDILTDEGYQVKTMADTLEGLKELKNQSVDILLLDLKMPGKDGIQVLRELRECNPDVIVIIMTAYATVETAREAMRLGAYDYLTKPLDPDVVISTIHKALEKRQQDLEMKALAEEPRILVVDDDPIVCKSLEDIFKDEGYHTIITTTGCEALEKMRRESFNILIADLKLPDMSGIELITAARAIDPEILAIIITGYPSIETAVESIKTSAYDYIIKPLDPEEVVAAVKRGWEKQRLAIQNKQLLQRLRQLNQELKASEERYRTLYEAGKIVNQGMALDQILESLVDVISNVLGYDHCSIRLVDKERNVLVTKVVRGVGEEYLKLRDTVPIGQHDYDLSGLTVKYGKPQYVWDLMSLDLPEEVKENIIKKYGLKSYLTIPLKTDHEVIGVFSIMTTEHYKFSEDEIKVFSAFANQASLAITRARLLESLRKSEEKYRAFNDYLNNILDNMGNYMIEVVNRDHIIEYENRTIRSVFGSGIGKKCYQHYLKRKSPCPRCTAIEAMDKGEMVYKEDIIDGKVYAVMSYPLRKPDGSICAIEIIEDITEHKKLQQQLIQSERLASLGELISGVAHELNNPLASVLGFSQLLLTEDLNDSARRDVEVIIREATRCQKIVQNLLTFARRHKPEKTYVGINGIIESVLELRAYNLRLNNIKVIKEFDEDLPKTVADYHQLQQVFLNLINNAEQAMVESHQGGTLRVRTEKRGNLIRALVIDDGPGIPPEHMSKIFDPFFTTKEVGKGTGLGLSICYGIIQEHGGRIYAESEVGKGATFVVELPIVSEASLYEKTLTREEKAEIPPGKHILVVDDEDAVIDFLQRALKKEGHRVEIAKNGPMAWEKIRRRNYDAILLDLRLPKMSGETLFKRIEEVKPHLSQRVIFMTGDISQMTAQNLAQERENPWLCKPFTLEQLNQALGRIGRA